MFVRSRLPFKERQRVLVSVRPERVRLDPVEACPNTFGGTVVEVIYLGDHKLVHVRLNETSVLVAKVPNAGANIDIKPSQSLSLGWNSSDAVLIPA